MRNINEYKTEYKRNTYDQIMLYVNKGMRDKLRTIATGKGQSLNAFLNIIIQDYIERNEKDGGNKSDFTVEK